MDPYDERLVEIRAAVDRALNALEAGLTADDRKSYAEEIAQLEKVLTFTKLSIEISDPGLVSAATHELIVGAADRITNDVVGALGDTDHYADAVLDAALHLPGASNRDLERAALEAATGFERSLTERSRRIEDDLRTALEDVETLRQDLEKASGELETEIETHRQSLQTSVDSLASSISQNQTTLDGQLTSHSREFTESERARDRTFRGKIQAFEELLTKALERSETEARSQVDELRRIVGEAVDLQTAYAQHVIANEFDAERKQQRSVAEVFRVLTIVFALCAAAAAILAIFHQPDKASSVAAKLAVSAIFGGLAGYTARQSGRHQRREARARKLQIELTAFGPFVESLGPEQKEEERVILARKTFTGGAGADEDTFRDPGPTPISLLMKERLKELKDES